MKSILYNIGIQGYYFLLGLVTPFNRKAKLFVDGRKDWEKHLQGDIASNPGDYLWIHAASLGEFEQGRPIIEAIRKRYKKRYRLLLTFYSPSGFEVRKDYPMVDIVMYLPVDTKHNVDRFISLVKPKLGILIKYEFWLNYIQTSHNKGVPLISVSSIFREGQLYFNKKGDFMQSKLHLIDHFYVQNKKSRELLANIGISQVTVTGDTRFDRVQQLVADSKEIPIADRFTDDQPTMVLGSVWKEDMEVIKPFIDRYIGQIKFIVAPHHIDEKSIAQIKSYFPADKTVCFSNAQTATVRDYHVLIIDNIGMLSALYRYGHYAYIGGAFGQGLHNILEAITWLIPVFYGKSDKNKKFDEVGAAEDNGIGFPIADSQRLIEVIKQMNDNPAYLEDIATAAREFLSVNMGATNKVMEGISKILEPS